MGIGIVDAKTDGNLIEEKQVRSALSTRLFALR